MSDDIARRERTGRGTDEERAAEPRKWPRTTRFGLSELGGIAARAYLDTIVAARAEQGRRSFDAARSTWAETHRIQPEDGLYLREMVAGPVTLIELVERLEGCGPERRDCIAALDRLVSAGLVSPIERRSTEHR